MNSGSNCLGILESKTTDYQFSFPDREVEASVIHIL